MHAFDPANEFRFQCPIFGSTTKFTHCVEIRDRLFKGQGPDVRKGCQACISSSKCPIVHIMKDSSTGKDISRYTSATPVVGKLAPAVLERIANIRTQPHHLDRYGVDDAQRNAIMKANTTFASGNVYYDDMEDVPQQKPVFKRAAKPPVETDAIVTAAQTGDLAAALNQGATT